MELDDRRAADLVGRVEDLLERVETVADPADREAAVELVRALLELYGEGLARLTAAAVATGGEPVAAGLAADELVSHLLLLHGLHPVDLPTRVAAAAEAACARRGGPPPDLVRVDGAVARVRLPAAAATGCRSSAAALATELAEAVRAAAPEVERVDVERPPPAPAVIPVASLRRGPVSGGRRTSTAGADR